MSETTRTVAISGRISEQDFNYMMSLPLSGMVTASEKLRHVCAFFRRYNENQQTYAECRQELQRLLTPITRDMKEIEHELHLKSELVDKLLTLLPEMMATLVTSKSPDNQDEHRQYLQDLEARLLLQTLSLMEHLLRMAMTSKAPAYNPKLLEGKLETIVELVGLLSKKFTN